MTHPNEQDSVEREKWRLDCGDNSCEFDGGGAGGMRTNGGCRCLQGLSSKQSHRVRRYIHRLRTSAPAEDVEARVTQMVEESHRHWDLWQMAFGAAMNTEGSFKSFLRRVVDGTALDWWKTDYLRGLEDGSIVSRSTPEAQTDD